MVTKKPVKKSASTGFDIDGVKVNLDAPDLQNVKTLEDLQALELFSHLEGDKKLKAEEKLLKKLGLSGSSVPVDDQFD